MRKKHIVKFGNTMTGSYHSGVNEQLTLKKKKEINRGILLVDRWKLFLTGTNQDKKICAAMGAAVHTRLGRFCQSAAQLRPWPSL